MFFAWPTSTSRRRGRRPEFVLFILVLISAIAAAPPKPVTDSIASETATSPSQKAAAGASSSRSTSSSSPGAAKARRTRQQNFYNYRTNYDDDRTYAYYEDDMRGNYVSDFGVRTNRPTATTTSGRVRNPFEIFGRRSQTSTYDDGSYTATAAAAGDDDYLLMNDGGEAVLDDAVGGGGGAADDYDDYQELDDPVPETRGRRTRIRIRPTAGAGGGAAAAAGGGGWSGNTHLSTSRRPGDASYSFGYSALDHSRYEYSDPFGNVNGFYTYIDDDGFFHRVSYTAGAGTGFVVNSNRLDSTSGGGGGGGWTVPTSWGQRIRPAIPTSPNPPRVKVSVGGGGWAGEDEEDVYQSFGHRVPTSRPNSGGWTPPRRRKPSYVVKIRRPAKQDPAAWIYYRPPNPGRPAPGNRRRPRPPSRRPPEDSAGWTPQDLSDSPYPKDASYHFAYDAGDHDRNEYSDPWGNVRGSYSYIDPTGIRRTVHYSAGSVGGFKILSASPSQIVQRVYQGMLPQGLPGPVSKLRPKPSAIVYHLHPDSGWKPWEASETNSIGSQRRTRPLKNNVATSYQYQTFGKTDEDVSAEDSNTNVNVEPATSNSSPRRPAATATSTTSSSFLADEGQGQAEKVGTPRRRSGSRHRGSPQPQLHQYHREVVHRPRPSHRERDEDVDPIYEQEYLDGELGEDEYQIVADTKYEPLKTNSETGKIMVQSYRGGYGDKNPLLVMSESNTRPRESSGSAKDGADTETRRGKMMTVSRPNPQGFSAPDDYEMPTSTSTSTTSRPISVARMMSMRMSKSKKMMKMMKDKSSMAMVKSINEASNNMRRRGGKMNGYDNTPSGSGASRLMHMSNMQAVRERDRMSMDQHHSPTSVSQSQSYRRDEDEDEIQVQVVQSPSLKVAGADRRVAAYPMSNQKVKHNLYTNGLVEEAEVGGRMMLLVPMPLHHARRMHYPLMY